MATQPLPSPEVLRQLLECDPETGKLFWKERGPEWFQRNRFSPQSNANKWNGKHAHKEAFATPDKEGYLYGKLLGERLAAHRVVYAFCRGQWAEDQIDHINGDRTDNRICNLRAVSRAENAKNVKMYSTNSSGVVGVARDSSGKKWLARIGVNRKLIMLGTFAKRADAIASRVAAERQYGFHANHGR